MEFNIDFKNDPYRTICWIISILSWLLFLLVGWIAFLLFHANKKEVIFSFKNIWCFIDLYNNQENIKTPYYPIQAKGYYYTILFLILLLAGTIAFGSFIYKSSFRKDENVFKGMTDTFSRFHFIPLICTIALFIVGTSKKLFFTPDTTGSINDMIDNINSGRNGFITSLVFSLFGLVSLILIRFKTKLEQPIYFVYSINCFYSCLICLYVYCFFYSSIYIGVYNKYKNVYSEYDSDPLKIPEKLEKLIETIHEFMNRCGIAFSIMIGIINLPLSLLFKDFIIPAINFIIYLGLQQYFFSVDKLDKEIKEINSAEGALDIIMMILTIVIFGITIYFNFIAKYLKKGKEDGLIN